MKNEKKLGIGAMILGGIAVIAGAVLATKKDKEEEPFEFEEIEDVDVEDVEIEEE